MRNILFVGVALSMAACNTTGSSNLKQSTGKALSTAEIQELFAGKTSDWKKEKNGWKMKIFTSKDKEQIVHYLTGKKAGEKRIIHWTAENNQHCGLRDGGKYCGEIIDIGNGVYHKNKDDRLRNTITNFIEGKHL